ncbi:MAG: alpha/beta fold hydrolase [Rhodobacteraceae bacterium]|nr:alpha/beta fold hydrolase [Paracoccaceae bacterium]
MDVMDQIERFELGDAILQSGERLPDAWIGYEVHGRLSPARDNAVLIPSFYGGRSEDYRAMIGPGRALDPERWCIILPNMFGSGWSSSPSNTPRPFGGPRFPRITHLDNVQAQARLVSEVFGVERLALVAGFSMGGQQANMWAATFPDRVARLAPWCAAARTAPHTWVFLEGPKAGLVTDAAFRGGWYDSPPEQGLRAFGRIWAGWGPSQTFYRDGLYRSLGQISARDHMIAFWEANFMGFDANDLLCMLATWQDFDIADQPAHGGDFAVACAAIRARSLLMPGATDLYFPPADNHAQAMLMQAPVEVREIPSEWGHIAGAPGLDPTGSAFLEDALTELLAAPDPLI